MCVKNNDESCLRVYKKVQDAKKFVLDAIEHDEAGVLNNTINKIVARCGGEKSKDDFTCVGSVVSLYFLNNEKYQKQIQEALNNAGSNSIKLVFSSRYEWMYNRSDTDQWISFVKNLPAEAIPPMEKKTVIESFEGSKKGFEKFGVML